MKSSPVTLASVLATGSNKFTRNTGDEMELSELTDKAIDYIVDALADEPRLSPWEKSFVESITDQWTRSRRLSEKQKEVLGRIWDKV